MERQFDSQDELNMMMLSVDTSLAAVWSFEESCVPSAKASEKCLQLILCDNLTKLASNEQTLSVL